MFRKKTRVTFSFTDSSSFSFYFISTAGRKVLLELESEIGPSWVSLIAQKAEAHRCPVCRLRPNFSQNVNTRSYSRSIVSLKPPNPALLLLQTRFDCIFFSKQVMETEARLWWCIRNCDWWNWKFYCCIRNMKWTRFAIELLLFFIFLGLLLLFVLNRCIDLLIFFFLQYRASDLPSWFTNIDKAICVCMYKGGSLAYVLELILWMCRKDSFWRQGNFCPFFSVLNVSIHIH